MSPKKTKPDELVEDLELGALVFVKISDTFYWPAKIVCLTRRLSGAYCLLFQQQEDDVPVRRTRVKTTSTQKYRYVRFFKDLKVTQGHEEYIFYENHEKFPPFGDFKLKNRPCVKSVFVSCI